jgi:ADP-ribose pyrophosphatase YjhB (NUDIX family)
MLQTTLCFLVRGDEVLLAMKKRSFGIGKWNGVGGKVLEGESIAAAAVREIKEEIDVVVAEEDLRPVGVLSFIYKGQS